MEIRQLETFICVARTLSFSKATEVLYLSQPTISAHISLLEKQLNVQLLVRNTREVSLTKAGKDFLVYAQNIITIRDQAINNISGKDFNTRGYIDIISSTIPAQHLLPEIIASFQKQWPNIIFRVDQVDSRQVEREMSGFRYDFGMVGVLPGNTSFIHYPICDDELVLILPNDVPQSNETIRNNFSDFVIKYPFIMRECGSGTRTEIEAVFSKTGINLQDLRISAYFSDAHSILLAVSHGMGISMISKVAAAMYAEAGLLRSVEMHSQLFHRHIYLLHNKELRLSPVQQTFAKHVRQYYGNS